jgi:SAM-dependent methyltransferase
VVQEPDLPDIEENRRQWNEWDWSKLGEEWTPDDPQWKSAILEYALDRHLPERANVLEIGPGGGRWTAELLDRKVHHLIAVDLAERCIDLCRERFAGAPNLELHVNDGRDLSFVPDRSIDFVWSFDVFVHIEAPEVEQYFREFARVMKPGARGSVHYASIDRAQNDDARFGWRANFTSDEMFAILERVGLTLLHDYYEPWISSTNSSIVVFER